jgi:predicted permease
VAESAASRPATAFEDDMPHTLQDLRYAVRMLIKNPGFTCVAVLVLALGIGANTAVFSLVNGLLLKPLPGMDGTVVGLFSKDREKPDDYRGFSYPNYADIREANQIFSELAGHTFAMVGVTEGNETRRVFAELVTANYFSTFRVGLAQGRPFTLEEERPGSRTPVVIVSHAYWKKKGSDPGLVGGTIQINAQDLTVVGVAPEGFTGTMALVSPEIYLPLGMYDVLVNDMFKSGLLADRRTEALVLLGRLKPGVTLEGAGAQLASLSAQLEKAYPAENRNQVLTVHRLARMGVSDAPQDEGPLAALSALLLGVAGVVLLIACLNLANMMLARGSARGKEIAIRLALGGTRVRVVRQLLTEGLVLAIAGGALGLLFSYWSMRLLVATLTPLLPVAISFQAGPDARVLAGTVAFCGLSTLFFALGPAWKLSRADVVPELKEQAGEMQKRSGGRFAARNVLVVGQVALSLALLVAGGLFIRGALKAAVADPGFRLERGLLVNVDPSLAGYDEARGRETYRRVLERIRSLPGIESASLASIVPFGEFTESERVQRLGASPDRPASGEPDGTYALQYIVGASYFRSLGLPVLRGRDFTRQEEEADGGPRVAIIDEPLARSLFAGADPIGQMIQLIPRQQGERPRLVEVVGIAPGLRHDLFDKSPGAHVYLPFGQHYRAGMNLHVRMSGGDERAEAAMLGTLRREIRALDERLPILSVKSLRAHRDGSLPLWLVRTGANLFTAFGTLAMLLAVVGVYGVKAYVVSRRTREIGIRIALGAAPRDVLWLVLREGLGLTLTGVAIGLGLAAVAARLVSSLLYEVSAFDPIIFLAAPLLLASAATLASYIPARRATRVVPLTALRFE